ncbi:MAG: phosphoribosylanthranilate isomerase [Eubacterium sp.]|nr:phosphoribosylanthranilate isomerase [Candidatus Colimonas fimequi]
MAKIKLCGLSRPEDIAVANEIMPEYIGFVFAAKSRRYLDPEKARALKKALDGNIKAVGVFVRENPEQVAYLLSEGIIDVAQLHGGEDEEYVGKLRSLTDKPLIQAFRIDTADDVKKAVKSGADYILLDSGDGGTGTSFDWSLIKDIDRPYFLAGGLDSEKIKTALEMPGLYGLDVSSGIETDGLKDPVKMREFARSARNE